MKKNVIITGAGEGIGRAIVEVLKDEYNLILIDKNQLHLDNFKDCKDVSLHQCDVTKREQFESVIKETVSKFGEIEAIINNAAVMNVAPLETQTLEIQHAMVDVNILGVINGTQLVIDSMKRNGQGTIINVASTAGKYPYMNHAVYCGTKHAVRGFSKVMRQELAPLNIRVAIVSPGAVYTNLAKNGGTGGEFLKKYLEWRDEHKAYVQPIDVAKAIEFVLNCPQNVLIREIEMTSIKQIH